MAKRFIAVFFTLCLLAGRASAIEGAAMLSPDDLEALQGSFERFLSELETVLVERGLLAEGDRETWRQAQLGDFLTNGGYGSILIGYQPDALRYVREEAMAVRIATLLPCGTLELDTMRRYTPADGSEEGLLLSFSLTDAQSMPLPATLSLSCSTGVFYKWDALGGGYGSVGITAVSEGESLLWAAPAPGVGAADATIIVELHDLETGEMLGTAQLVLRVENDSYVVDDDALSPGS